MTRFLLATFDRFAWAIRMAGADYGQFRTILATKLTLDNRRQLVTRFAQQETNSWNGLLASVAFFALMGGFVALVLLARPSPLLAFTIIFSFVMFMLAMSLIADFSAVLLDTVDLMVLGPRPVSGRTILVARLVHICTYLGLLGVSLSVGTIVVGALQLHPLFSLLFLTVLAAAIAFVVLFVSLFYLLALRFTDGERFRDVVLFVQIGMSFFVIGGYQILPQVVPFDALTRVDLSGAWWAVLYPPVWFAAPFELFFGHASPRVLILTAEALVLPVVGLWFVVRVLSPNFGRMLSKLQQQPGRAEGVPTRTGRRGWLMSLLRRATTGSAEERLGFDLSWILAGRDRPFKLRVYPSIAFLMIFPAIMFCQSGAGIALVTQRMLESRSYLLGLYATALVLPMVLIQIGFSPEFEAGWIYYALPVGVPGRVLRGSTKAMLLRFGALLFGLVAGTLFAVMGWDLVPHAILAACQTWTIAVMYSLFLTPRLPFSESPTMMQSNGQFGRNMLALLLPAGAGFLHNVLAGIPHAVPVATLPAFVLALWMTSRYDALDWATLELRRSAT
jgi:ABC-2 type transport system permease protein